MTVGPVVLMPPALFSKAPMKFIVLKELPQGQQPGEVIDVHEDVGAVLVTVGAAREATEDEAKPARRRYQRKDLVAVGD